MTIGGILFAAWAFLTCIAVARLSQRGAGSMNSTPWQKGNLALCVKRDAWRRMFPDGSSQPGSGPGCGTVLRVREVCSGVVGPVTLRFSDYPDIDEFGWKGYNAACFRKIEPHTPDEEDAETLRLLTGVNVEVG